MYMNRYNKGNTFTKPENALRNGKDLRATGKPEDLKHAVYILHGTVMSRKFRAYMHEGNLQETVMQLYCELAYDVGDLKTLREGLYSYRGMTQGSSNEAFVETLSSLLDYGESKLKSVEGENIETAQDLTDDLEDEYRPESLMYSCLESGSKPQTRVVVDQLKRVWAVYKLVLDLLKSLPKYETFYHRSAQRAFDFCVEHNRPQEFRRLVETLKYQYQSISKLKNKVDRSQLQRPERHFATRIAQLKGTSALKLWRLALETVDDLVELGFHDYSTQRLLSHHTDVAALDRTVDTQLLATHYSLISTHLEQCSLIFWETKDYLYHSLSLVKLFLHNRKRSDYVGSDEERQLANQVILSISSVPKNHIALKGESPARNIAYDRRLRNIIGHNSQVTYDIVIDMIFGKEIHLSASPAVLELLNLVHKGFSENSLSSIPLMEKVLSNIKEECNINKSESYLDLIYSAAVTKVINNLSTVYDSIKISRLLESFLNNADPTRVEDILLDIGSESAIKVEINAGEGFLNFKYDISGVKDDESRHIVYNSAVAVKKATQQLIKSGPTRSEVFNDIRAEIENQRLYIKNRKDIAAQILADLHAESERIIHQQQELDNEKLNVLRELDSQRKINVLERERKQTLTAQLHEQNLNIATKILGEIEREAEGLPIKIQGVPLAQIKPKDIAIGKYTYQDACNAIMAARKRELQRIKDMRSQEMKTIDYYSRAVRENSKDMFKKRQEQFKHTVYEIWKNEYLQDKTVSGQCLIQRAVPLVKQYLHVINRTAETIPELFETLFQNEWKEYKAKVNAKVRQQNLNVAIGIFREEGKQKRII